MKKLLITAIFLALSNAAIVNAREATEVKQSEVSIKLPNLQMVRQDGKKILFADEMNDGRVVVVSFVYTSCSAICPMISQTIAKLQGKLGVEIEKVHLVSISLDPEHDTPKQLTSYAEKFHAGNSWHYYTGTEDDSIKIQKAMGVYRGDKMNHVPVTLLKASQGDKWIRLDGFVTADDILRAVHDL
ncbi:MAG: SCO family protein [Methylophilaceae bacterium]